MFIFNYIRLNKGGNKKSVLCTDLNFSVILKSFEISDVLVHSELFFWDVWQEDTLYLFSLHNTKKIINKKNSNSIRVQGLVFTRDLLCKIMCKIPKFCH